MVEWLKATDCKSVGFIPTQVRILFPPNRELTSLVLGFNLLSKKQIGVLF